LAADALAFDRAAYLPASASGFDLHRVSLSVTRSLLQVLLPEALNTEKPA
jgi:hypothetical protein